jgi:putative transposase
MRSFPGPSGRDSLRRHAVRLARYQRRMSRRKPGSHRRRIARLAVARLHQRIANIRRDVAHKATSQIVSATQTIKVETLNLKAMVRNRHLAKSLSDASMGLFVNMLAWKAERAGRTFIKADQWFASSRTCSGYGRIHDMPLARQWMTCECGMELDRNENAPVNLLGYGEEHQTCSNSGAKRAGESRTRLCRLRCPSVNCES